MNSAAIFAAWQDYARGHSLGCSNGFRHNGLFYSFDAHPRQLHNGALQGRIFRQARGESPQDIGGFKIGADGSIVALPEELRGVLPTEPLPERIVSSIPEDVQ